MKDAITTFATVFIGACAALAFFFGVHFVPWQVADFFGELGTPAHALAYFGTVSAILAAVITAVVVMKKVLD